MKVGFWLTFVIYVVATTFAPGCTNTHELAVSSFGEPGKETSRASAASVISMGRDDDDGKGLKWHIGGGKD